MTTIVHDLSQSFPESRHLWNINQKTAKAYLNFIIEYFWTSNIPVSEKVFFFNKNGFHTAHVFVHSGHVSDGALPLGRRKIRVEGKRYNL